MRFKAASADRWLAHVAPSFVVEPEEEINISRDKIKSSSDAYYELETFCQINMQRSLLKRGLSDLRSGHGQTGGQIRQRQGYWLHPRYTLKLKIKKDRVKKTHLHEATRRQRGRYPSTG